MMYLVSKSGNYVLRRFLMALVTLYVYDEARKTKRWIDEKSQFRKNRRGEKFSGNHVGQNYQDAEDDT